jgi:antitoxin component of MazEF toxin-antitoxin module
MSKQPRLAKWGNSVALRLPAHLTQQLGIRDGTKVDITRTETGIRVTVIKP